jgi:hypothetical protein
MAPRTKRWLFDESDGERCPECGHAWIESGPAHFPDCRYFCLDGDRDEEGSPSSMVMQVAPSGVPVEA